MVRMFCIVTMALTSALYAHADDITDCESANGITPICGFASPEDIDVTADGEALIVGGFNLDNTNGEIRAYDLEDQTIEVIFDPDTDTQSAPEQEPWGDPACSGPPTSFAAHGIDLSTNPDGSEVLLTVNHTGRESIEWFEITPHLGRYKATWRGCVIVPAEYWINDLTRTRDGGFIASHMMPRDTAHTMFDRPPNDRLETGYLVRWHTDHRWTKVAGSEGALPNGVALSADGKTVFNNHYLSNQVVAIDLASGERKWTAAVSAAPDNMSITPDGRLLVAMHEMSLREIRDDCLGSAASYCGLPFAIAYIDADTGEVTPIMRARGPSFGGVTVAVQVADAIYLGAFHGNRIGRIALPLTTAR